MPKILLLESGSRGSIYWLFLWIMEEWNTNLCFSTFQHDPQNSIQSTQDPTQRRLPWHYADTCMANTTLVFNTQYQPVRRTTDHPESQQIHQYATLRGKSKFTKIGLNSLENLRTIYHNKGYSNSVTEILLASRKSASYRSYNVHTHRWFLYCKSKNHIHPSINDILNFLDYSLITFDLGYNSLNTDRSALSSFLPLIEGHKVGQHADVVRFLKGVFNLKPPTPRYSTFWDPDIILELLQQDQYCPAKTIPLKLLSHKCIMLLLLSSGQRLDTLHKIRMNDIIINQCVMNINIPALLKTSTPGFRTTKLIFRPFSNKGLCIFRYIKVYMQRTAALRKPGEEVLFLTYQKPHSTASKATLTRWVKALLSASGIDASHFRAHSARGAVMCKAKGGAWN